MTVWSALITALALTGASFLYQVINGKYRWGQAAEHSFFMAVAVGICVFAA